MKSYTDLEQSKKLAEFLPLESADMHYLGTKNDGYVPGVGHSDIMQEGYKQYYNYIPAWSLAALLNILPLGLYDESDSCDYELEINMIAKMPRYIRLGEMYHSQFPYDFGKDTLLDNIVESIIWLNDNNYFGL